MNNPPAFPIPFETHHDGMTLRDYFAAKAMQAMIAHPESDAGKPASVYAKGAYVMADAMMKTRKA